MLGGGAGAGHFEAVGGGGVPVAFHAADGLEDFFFDVEAGSDDVVGDVNGDYLAEDQVVIAVMNYLD
jgi:hypothetical protein